MRPGDIIRNEANGELGQYQGLNDFGWDVVMFLIDGGYIYPLPLLSYRFYTPIVLRWQFSLVFSVN